MPRHALKVQSDFLSGAGFADRLAAHNACQNLWLALRNNRVKGKCDPERKALRVVLMAGHKQAAARDVPRLANLRLLPQGRNPTKSYRKAQTYPCMLAKLHCGVISEDERQGDSNYTPGIPKLL